MIDLDVCEGRESVVTFRFAHEHSVPHRPVTGPALRRTRHHSPDTGNRAVLGALIANRERGGLTGSDCDWPLDCRFAGALS